MGSLRIAWELQKAAIRGQLGYRANFALLAVMGVAYQGSGFAFVWTVLRQFHTIDGWSFADIAFLYAMRLLAHAAFYLPLNQLDFLADTVREGSFDRFLVRPLNPLLQLMTNRFQLNAVGDLLTAAAFFAVAASSADVDFSPVHVLYLVAAVIGGALAEGAFVLATSSLGFRFLQIWAVMGLVDSVYLMFGSYPIRIFGSTASWLLTWVVPVAFVAYIPSSVMLGRTSGLSLSPAVAWAAPAVGLAFFAVAYAIWFRQLRGYQSVGA